MTIDISNVSSKSSIMKPGTETPVGSVKRSNSDHEDEIDELNNSVDYHVNKLSPGDKEQLLYQHLHHTAPSAIKNNCKNCQVIQNNSIGIFKSEAEIDNLPIWEQFDKSFLVVMIVCNYTQGFKQFLDLSLLTLYKDTMKLQPAEVQFFMGLIAIPWSLKIIYGFMSDNIKVFDSKRKGHIMMNCLCCITSIGCIIAFGSSMGKYLITFCIFVSQVNMAYNDTVTDALTVQATKFGVKDGNENLNSLSYFF